MDWKKKLSKLSGRMTKENWIVLLCLGLIMMILAVPWPKKTENGKIGGEQKRIMEETGNGQLSNALREIDDGVNSLNETFLEEELWGKNMEGNDRLSLYEAALEQRVKEVLKRVEGVGEVDVLIVLKSSEERVYRTDGKTSQSSTTELDSSGGSRQIKEEAEEYSTVLSAGGGSSLGEKGGGPLLEKELRPEISGIVISAQGGASPTIKAEITGAMEALFGLPAHKIKVLKRVE